MFAVLNVNFVVLYCRCRLQITLTLTCNVSRHRQQSRQQYEYCARSLECCENVRMNRKQMLEVDSSAGGQLHTHTHNNKSIM